MTKKHYSIDQLSTATTRQAQSEMASMQRALNKLRDSVSGLHQALKSLNPVNRSRTKRTTTSPSLLDDLGMIGISDLLGEAGLSSGYQSSAQNAGKTLAEITLGQRIR